MIRYSVLYPATEGASFDHDYYRDQHLPLVLRTWGLDASTASVDRGLTGPYVAALHLTFASREAMEEAMAGEGTAALVADVPNYTTITPVRQVSVIDV